MTLKDWKKNVDMREKISYENQKTGDEVFITPKDFRRPNGSWELYILGKIGVIYIKRAIRRVRENDKKYYERVNYDSLMIIDYRGKREAKRALFAFMRSH